MTRRVRAGARNGLVPSPAVSSPASNPHHEKRWLILGVIAIAQLMVVLDSTIVNIALPSAQEDLGFDDDLRQWVITAYALAFGSAMFTIVESSTTMSWAIATTPRISQRFS